MSKLFRIGKILNDNKEISVIGTEKIDYSSGLFDQKVIFSIAPKDRVLLTVDELQKFMESLISDIEPTMTEPFVEGINDVGFGALYFDECYGIKTFPLKTVLIDEDVADFDSFKGKKKLERRIEVRLYPSIKVAHLAKKNDNLGISKFFISKRELTRMRIKLHRR